MTSILKIITGILFISRVIWFIIDSRNNCGLILKWFVGKNICKCLLFNKSTWSIRMYII